MAGFQYFKKAGGAANYKRKEDEKQPSKNNSDFKSLPEHILFINARFWLLISVGIHAKK
jgi:hypothetical protein